MTKSTFRVKETSSSIEPLSVIWTSHESPTPLSKPGGDGSDRRLSLSA
jgi:hypothetical protein